MRIQATYHALTQRTTNLTHWKRDDVIILVDCYWWTKANKLLGRLAFYGRYWLHAKCVNRLGWGL